MRIVRPGFVPLLVLFCMLAGGTLRDAGGQLLGPEFQVNSATTNRQEVPRMASDGAGNFVVAWQSDSLELNNPEVAGRLFDSTGVPMTGELQVNVATSGQQDSPSVAMTGADGFVVVWLDTDVGSSDFRLYGQRYDSSGQTLGSAFLVSANAGSRESSVAGVGSGNFVVAWGAGSSAYGSYSDVVARRFDSAGVPLGGEFQVNTYTTSNQLLPAVASDGAGNFVVVWESRSQDGSSYGVYGQRFDAAGLPAGSEFRVNSYTTGDQWGPAVAAKGSGGFVVAWVNGGITGSSGRIFVRRYDASGLPIGGEIPVSPSTWPPDQGYPAVAVDSQGNFLVVGKAFGPGDDDVYGQFFDSSGQRIGGGFRVNTFTSGTQWLPAAAAIGEGTFVVGWESWIEDGSDYGIFAQRVTLPFFYDGFESGDACAWSAAVGGGCP